MPGQRSKCNNTVSAKIFYKRRRRRSGLDVTAWLNNILRSILGRCSWFGFQLPLKIVVSFIFISHFLDFLVVSVHSEQWAPTMACALFEVIHSYANALAIQLHILFINFSFLFFCSFPPFHHAAYDTHEDNCSWSLASILTSSREYSYVYQMNGVSFFFCSLSVFW